MLGLQQVDDAHNSPTMLLSLFLTKYLSLRGLFPEFGWPYGGLTPPDARS
jgi:hypothetical protein